jgi:hypothetical protein
MSCKRYQDKLVDARAGGEGALVGELAAHLRACAECKEFYEAQLHLFGAIDLGVREMVNETVPASLLPGVRALVAEVVIPRRMWSFSWGFVSVAVAAALVISVGVLRWSPENTSKQRDRSPAVVQGVAGGTGVKPVPRQVITAAPKHRSTEARTEVVPRGVVKTPEVLVLAEERAAFARFVTDLPEERDVAVAFTRPATDATDEGVEIALLQIDELEVKPLESSNRE